MVSIIEKHACYFCHKENLSLSPLPDSTHASYPLTLHSASVPSVVALFTTCYQISHDTCRPCLSKPQHRLSVSFGRVSLQAPPSRHAPSSAHPVTGYGFSQEIQKYPKTEVLQDVTPTPPSTFPYLQQALKPSCKSPQSPRKAHQHPPPSYTPGSA